MLDTKSKKRDPGREEACNIRFRDRIQETFRRMGRGMRPRRRAPKPPDIRVVSYTCMKLEPPTGSSGLLSSPLGTLSLPPSSHSTAPSIAETCHKTDDTSRPTTPKVRTWPKMSKELPDRRDPETRTAKNGVFIPGDMGVGPGTRSTVELGHNDPIEQTQWKLSKLAKMETIKQTLVDSQPVMRPSTASSSTEFVHLWEQKLLPQLVRILDANVKGAYHINVRRGSAGGGRIIDVMSTANGAQNVRCELESARDKALVDLGTEAVFEFRGGELGRSKDRQNSEASALSDGSVCPLKNPWLYRDPVMGDSVGSDALGCSGSATLGPSILVGGKTYRLVNWHVFDDRDGGGTGRYHGWSDTRPPEDLHLVHPSPDDCRYSSHKQPDFPIQGRPARIGKVVAFSGLMNRTYRRPRSMQSLLGFGDDADVRTVTDWALAETNQTENANQIRNVMLGEPSAPLGCLFEKTADPVLGGRMVVAAGRSSGYSFGQTCEVLSLSKLEDGTKIRNWAVESHQRLNPPWCDGIGIAGDSGAPIIDFETNKLLGQVWGQNVYEGNPAQPRIAYFTSMSDIFDDIKDRWPEPGQCLPLELPSGRAATGDSAHGSEAARPGLLDIVYDQLVPEARRSRARAVIPPSCGSAVVGHWVPHASTWPLLAQTAQA